jgi:hypothetical protein
MAALGHGRSYGAHSRVLVRTLPGILESGLWRDLEVLPRLPTRALVTDVGNDVMYGASAAQILAWVDEALRRLACLTPDIVVTDLPLASIRTLSPIKFRAVRAVLFPSCRLSFEHVLGVAEQVNDGVQRLAGARGIRFVRLEPSWYGFDPIHIRPSLWRPAWQEILGANCAGSRSSAEALRLYLMRPERRWLFGVEQFTAQTGTALARGARVWLY